MALAFKVAGNSYVRNGGKYTSSTGTAKQSPQRYYSVSGIWPRYEVMVNWEEGTRQILWGKKALTAFEVTMRIEGYRRHKPTYY